MKKLESLKSQKFSLSQDDMLQIKGGIVEFSYSYSTTVINNKEVTDETLIDMCLPTGL